MSINHLFNPNDPLSSSMNPSFNTANILTNMAVAGTATINTLVVNNIIGPTGPTGGTATFENVNIINSLTVGATSTLVNGSFNTLTGNNLTTSNITSTGSGIFNTLRTSSIANLASLSINSKIPYQMFVGPSNYLVPQGQNPPNFALPACAFYYTGSSLVSAINTVVVSMNMYANTQATFTLYNIINWGFPYNNPSSLKISDSVIYTVSDNFANINITGLNIPLNPCMIALYVSTVGTQNLTVFGMTVTYV
jgi:hypothetical protein